MFDDYIEWMLLYLGKMYSDFTLAVYLFYLFVKKFLFIYLFCKIFDPEFVAFFNICLFIPCYVLLFFEFFLSVNLW